MVKCPICKQKFKQITNSHIATHNMTSIEFEQKFKKFDRKLSGENHSYKKSGKTPKTRQCKRCNGDIPLTIIIDGKRRFFNTRYHCLKCSPYKSNKPTLNGRICKLCNKKLYDRQQNTCKNCKDEKKDQYNSKEGKRNPKQEYINAYLNKRRHLLKKKMVKYKGGKCKNCKCIKHDVIFDFHHIDPSKKEYTISKIYHLKWEIIKKELDKCIMLCSNCHRLLHAGVTESG